MQEETLMRAPTNPLLPPRTIPPLVSAGWLTPPPPPHNPAAKTVYLAGPITGFTFAECTSWRDYAITELAKEGIRGLSPMRGKEYLEQIAKDVALTADGDKYKVQGPLSTNRGIMTRDHWDATRCDVLLVNFLGAKIVSIGTVMEIAWSWDNGIPVVLVSEEDDIHWNHGMIKEATGFHVTTLQAGIDLVKAILR